MKRNVDLTENRVFSQGTLPDIQSLAKSYDTNRAMFLPWNFRLINNHLGGEYDLDRQRESVFVTGDRKQRMEVKFLREMDSEYYCDCCGKEMPFIPWGNRGRLCKECYEHYESQNPANDRCLWRKFK